MPRDPRLLLAIAAGGTVGTLARALAEEATAADPALAGHWPWATFAVNLVGAALLGVVAARLRPGAAGVPAAERRLRGLLGTGLCGGLTTFSTLQLEVVDLVRADAAGLAAAYLVLSVALGLLLVAAGLRLGRPGRAVGRPA